MSAAPSWPLICVALEGRTFRSATCIALGLNWIRSDRSEPKFQGFCPEFVLQTFKTQNDARAHNRTRPSQLFGSRTEKARNLTVSQRLTSGTRRPAADRVFLLPTRYGLAIVEIRGLSPRIPTHFRVRPAPGCPVARLLHHFRPFAMAGSTGHRRLRGRSRNSLRDPGISLR